METNRKYSCGKKTCNIDTGYFFITDDIKNKEVSVEYCPKEEMAGDYFTKPLQGAKFCQNRATMMKLEDWSGYSYVYLDHRSVLKIIPSYCM